MYRQEVMENGIRAWEMGGEKAIARRMGLGESAMPDVVAGETGPVTQKPP